jgi:hypothetical protein
VIIPSSIRDVIPEVSTLLISKRYLPGFIFDVFADGKDRVICPVDAFVIVQMILAVALAE